MNETVEVLPAETIEGSGEVTVAAQNRDGIVKTIARQIEAVKGAELRSTFEKLKLGAMVKQAVTLLGLDSKGGRGKVGEGVKGWWDENFKDASGQPVIKYTTLMNWIAAAENVARIMYDGSDFAAASSAKVMALLAKDPEQVVKKSDRKILESAEKVSNGMTMRQMLLWGDDAEPRHPGRPKGSKADLSRKPDTTDVVAAARAVWSQVIVPADRCAVALKGAAKLLTMEDVENAQTVLAALLDMLAERQVELRNN